MMKERNAEEKRALYWLCCCPCLGAVSIRKLGSYFGCYQELINIEETALEKAQILPRKRGFYSGKKSFPDAAVHMIGWEINESGL